MVKHKRKLLIIVVLPAVTILPVWFFHQRAGFSKEIRNVLLISIDTCRADHLSCYGYPRKTTPNIDALAKEGILFENVYSPVPMTLPAHSSMMTGTIPPYHGVHDNLSYRLNDVNVTLAEHLLSPGYNTAAFISSIVLDSQFGLNQGFVTYDDDIQGKVSGVPITERKAQEINKRAAEWLDNNHQNPFFLFLHYYDPHTPYVPPEQFRSKFPASPYAGEVAYTDYCIGQILGKLKSLSLSDQTLIVITSDHGEALGQHKEKTHMYFIYNESLKVPLVFHLPGGRDAKRVDTNVELIDIVPTICNLLGVEPPVQSQGKDLSGYFNHEKVPELKRDIYCESMFPTMYNCNSLLGVISDQWKYLQTTRPELYNLLEDPQESDDLITKEPYRAKILQDRLRRILEEKVRTSDAGAGHIPDEQGRKQLESLGYIGGGSVHEEFDFDQSKEDPKNLIDFHVSIMTVTNLMANEELAEAKALCQDLIDQRPGIFIAHFRMGVIAIKQKDWNKAISHLQEATKIDPDDFMPYYYLGIALSRLGHLDQAVEQFQKSLQIYPEQLGSHLKLASVYHQQEKLDQAMTHWTEALHLDSEQPVVLNNLAELLYIQGQILKAIEHWKLAIEFDPGMVRALNNLAWIMSTHISEEIRNPIEALRYAEKACELTGFTEPEYLDTLSTTYAACGKFDEAVEMAQKAKKIYLKIDQKDKVRDINRRLELFRSGKEYHE